MNLLGLKIILKPEAACILRWSLIKSIPSLQRCSTRINSRSNIVFTPTGDIDNCLHHSNIIKYADDTVIYVHGNDSE